MFQFDSPIESPKEDRLNRGAFAARLASALVEWKRKASIVIAIDGAWGSGKSSVINLVKSALDNRHRSKSPTIIEFNSWMFAGDVCDYMRSRGLGIDDLRDGGLFHSSWMQRVVNIYDHFDYDQFGALLLVPPRNDYLRESPAGSWSISDGNHRVLALAIKANLAAFDYQLVRSVVTDYGVDDLFGTYDHFEV